MCKEVDNRTDGELLAQMCGIIAGAAGLAADAMLLAEMPPLVKGELRGWLVDAAVRFGLAATSPAVWEGMELGEEWRQGLLMFLGEDEVEVEGANDEEVA